MASATDINRFNEGKSYDYVLKSDNPDKEIEYFWLTFKNSIQPYVNKEERENITQISDRLNELQKSRQYNKIETFISKYLHDICYSILMTKNYTEIDHLKTNIKRWEKISKHDIFDSTDLVGAMLKIASSIKTRKNKNKNEILDLIADWCKENQYKHKYTGYEFIEKIIMISINNGYYGTLDKLSKAIYLYQYVKIDTGKIDIKKISKYGGKTFAKFYKKYVKTNNTESQ